MVNTEKPKTTAQKKQMQIVETPKKNLEAPKQITLEQEKKIEKLEEKSEDKKNSEPKSEASVKDKEEKKKPIQKKPKVKRDYAVVNGTGLPISTKKARDTCKFIKRKTIEKAISDLEEVIAQKKPMPMKGEIPHQKGIMSGGYPKKTAEHFIQLLKSLRANAIANELEEPIIVEAIANIGVRPRGRFGRIKRKRSHVKIKCMEKKKTQNKDKEEEK